VGAGLPAKKTLRFFRYYVSSFFAGKPIPQILHHLTIKKFDLNDQKIRLVQINYDQYSRSYPVSSGVRSSRITQHRLHARYR
jgi:hypothetical protein